jgi:hypothetical protein
MLMGDLGDFVSSGLCGGGRSLYRLGEPVDM